MALSTCGVQTDEREREMKRHGTAGFPVACYHDDLTQAAVPWHWHDELEAGTVERGCCKLSTGTDEVIVHAGEGFLINGGVLHACMTEDHVSDCVLRSVVFAPGLVGGAQGGIIWEKYLQPVLRHSGARMLKLTPNREWENAAIEHIQCAWRACAEETNAFEITVRNALSNLMTLWCAHLPPDKADAATPDVRYEQRVKQMLTFIREHFAEDIDPRMIAASAAISESECLRCFKRLLNTTPNRYLTAYRLEQAEMMLLSTDLMIADIGDRCGFQEMSYFAKLFKNRYGCSPKAYREGKVSK